MEESASCAGESGSVSCCGEVLTGTSKNDDIDVSKCFNLFLRNGGHVAEIRDGRVVVLEESATEGLNVRYGDAFPTERLPGNGSGFNAAEE